MQHFRVMTTRRRSLIRYLLVLVPWVFVLGCGGSAPASSVPNPSSSPRGAPGSAPAAARLLDVAANQGWQDTGIRVEPQQKFQLRYRSGQVVDKDVTITDGDGSESVCGDPGCCEPMPDERRGALIARIAGSIMIVGNGGEFTAAEGGTIFLRINDCDAGLADNSGQLKVEFSP
jgi:hypothetical protein